MIVTLPTWHKLEPLLTEALDMEEALRGPWLARVQASHPDIGPLLAKMVATHERAERGEEMETVPRLAPPPPSAFSPGDRIGPFRLQLAIGRGGMGEVWLAEQADGRVVRQVALKLPRLDTSEIRAERFQRERDILAKLAHPNIARLYDAGVSDAGQPYLAMEYVDGETLDAYVAKRTLPLAARLALFRQVLGAVAHAHRHLIVHRDLKSANILVDAAGQVKLLDFGIAKLLEDQASAVASAPRDLTRMGGRVMTLRYAAPEQVAEGSITTATDIYSLGVVLHEMLTGESPYRALREGKRFTAMALLEEDIGAPSRLTLSIECAQARGVATPRQLARLLAGDLDAILLKALREDPAQRYASVALLEEDIERHLERRPVRARAGTWRYLAGRFALRHRLPIAMAAAVLVTLAAGLFVADRERRVAVAERERAQRHFASVRKLANSFMFEMHAEIEKLPGSLKARALLVKTSLAYLDALVSEATGDPALTRELAEAYRKIADVQGKVGGANLGDIAGSLANYEKSKQLFVVLDALRPNDLDVLRSHWTLSFVLARTYAMRTKPQWEREIATSVALAERAAALPNSVAMDRGRVAVTLAEQVSLSSYMLGQSPEAEAKVARAIALLEEVVRENQGDAELRGLLSSIYQRGSMILNGSARTQDSTRKAIEYNRKAIAASREAMASGNNPERMITLELSNLVSMSEMLSFVGEHREADRVSGEAIVLGKARLAGDPANAGTMVQVLEMLAQASHAAARNADLPRGVRLGREATAVAARLPEGTLASSKVLSHVYEAKYALGSALLQSAGAPRMDRESRLRLLRESRGLLAEVVAYFATLRVDKSFVYPEEDAKQIMAELARCEESIARLESGRTS